MATINIEVIPDEQVSSRVDAGVQSNSSSNADDLKSHSGTKKNKCRRTSSMSITYDTSMARKIQLTKLKIFYSIPFSIRLLIGYALFTSMVIATSVLIVYYTTRKPVKICGMNFKKTAQNPIDYNSGPRSVAIADFNHDTWLDMVVADNVTNNIIIYLRNINGTFSQQSRYSTGFNSAPNMVAVGDFNNDSHSDIAVANFGTHNIGIFLQLENGSFANQTELSTAASRPIAICLADFNNDTRLDIATANYGYHSISIFYKLGNGSFSNPYTYFTGYDSFPSSLVAGDFNNDNYLDLAIANYGTDNVGLLLQNSDGSFADQMVFSTSFGSHPISVAIGHFNDDSLLDIAVANSGTNNIGVLLNNGNGMFTNPTKYPTRAVSPYSVGVGDFNQDNRADIIITNKGKETICLYIGYGNGSFVVSRTYSSGSFSSISFAIGDMNKDNRLDVIVINDDTATIDIWLGSFEGFSDESTYGTDFAPSLARVGDFNNDARLDILIALDHDVGVFLGYGNGSFSNQTSYSSGSYPYPVAVGHFNNDTRLDIVVVSGYDNNVGVLLGYGNGSFSKRTTYPTDSSSISVAVGDFNNDARLDIVVVNSDDNNVTVLLGYGNGSFSSQTTYLTDCYPESVAVGDFNNDSRLDIVVVNGYDNNLSVLLGFGNGSFFNQTTYPTGRGPGSVAVGDFNNDTRLDIVAVSGYDNNVGVLLGYDDGSFSNQTTYPTGSYPSAVAVGDFNNDTRLDIVVASWHDSDVNVLLQYNRGFLRHEATYACGDASRLRYFAMADINNDTHLDMVVANYGTNNVGVLFGYGNGTFTSQLLFDTGLESHPSTIVIADFNGDNTLDIIVGNYASASIPILLGNGQGVFQRSVYNETDVLANSLFVTHGDFNNDRRSEIVVAYDGSDNVNVVVTYDTRFWTHSMTYFTYPDALRSVAAGDFNNDIRLDLVVVVTIAVASYYENTVCVLLGYGNGSFSNQTTYLTGATDSNSYSVAVGDFNNDTRLDIVVVNSDDNNVSVFLGYGNGSFSNQTTYPAGSYPVSVAVGDFNNDARLDIVVVNSGDSNVSVFLGYGNGSFSNQTTYPTGSFPSSVAVGDFNNDTRLDIVVANYNDLNISVLLGYGNGSFAEQATYPAGFFPSSVAVGDFNNDTRLDIVVVNSDDNDVSVLLGYGSGSFSNQTTYPTGSFPSSVAVGDFNNDTRMDIVVTNSADNTVGVLLGFGNGSFSDQTTYPTGYKPESVAVGDFNNDARLDIAVCNDDDPSVTIFLGHLTTVFFKQTVLSTGSGSRPHSFVIGDFNNDGYMDVGVANAGTDNIGIFFGFEHISFASQSTFSTGLNSSPYSIAAGDFNSDTYLDIVVANYHSDNVDVFLGYGDGSFANQATYSTDYQPLCVAVGDFNNDTTLDIVVANYGSNNLGVFLGHGDGTFAEMTRFQLEYGSHPFSVLVGDFNNDRKLDLAVANNGTDSLYILLQTC